MPESERSAQPSVPGGAALGNRMPSPVPRTIRAACILWIALGALSLLVYIGVLALSFARTPPGTYVAGIAPEQELLLVVSGVILGPVATGLIIVGIVTLTDVSSGLVNVLTTEHAPDRTTYAGVVSIVVAVLPLVVMPFVSILAQPLFSEGGTRAVWSSEEWALADLSLACCAGLLTAGVLAIVGRSDYEVWLQANKVAPHDPSKQQEC
jgi:hypothetical protein